METKVVCPKCSSDQLSFNKKGFNVKKAVGGLLIPGGVLWGLHGKDKIVCTCIACGNQFKAGEGKVVSITTVSSVQETDFSSKSYTKPPEDFKTQAKGFASALIGLGVLFGIILVIVFVYKSCTKLSPEDELKERVKEKMEQLK